MRLRFPRISLLLLLLVVSGPGLCAEIGTPGLPHGVRDYAVGPAPLFTLSNMDGETLALRDSLGQWVFVHFWASWCGPCREEMPAVQRLATLMANEALQLIMINTAEDEDTVFEFLSSFAPDMDSLMDRDGQATEAWQPRGLPATYLVDPEGQIRFQALGGRPWDQPEYLEFLRGLIKQ